MQKGKAGKLVSLHLVFGRREKDCPLRFITIYLSLWSKFSDRKFNFKWHWVGKAP